MLIISDFEKFGNILQQRLHSLLSHYEVIEHEHSLIINMLDRSNPDRIKNNELVFVGIDKQKELLRDKGHDLHWQYLNAVVLNEYGEDKENTDDLESPSLFVKLHKNQLAIKDIQIKNLCDYFDNIPLYEYLENINYSESIQEKHPIDVLTKVAEYHIFKDHFNIAEDKYLPIPLIQFRHFDGIAYILFKAKEVEEDEGAEKRRVNILKRTIRFFSVEYENLLLGWPNEHDEDDFDFQKLESDELWQDAEKSPIFSELKYREYYRASKEYYEIRIQQNEKLH